MAKILHMARDQLDELADRINAGIQKIDDNLVAVSIDLHEAKGLCRERGVTFKNWLLDNVRLAYTYAVRLSNCGGSPDPVKAIADLREAGKQRSDKSREKVVSRNTTPKPGTIIITDDEDPDYEEFSAPTLPEDMRIRGLLARAAQAKEWAEADDMAGIETTEEMREAVSETARAWINLLSKLEGE